MTRVLDWLDAAFGHDHRAAVFVVGLVVFWVAVFGYLYMTGDSDSVSQEERNRITDSVRERLCREGTASPDLCLEWQKERE